MTPRPLSITILGWAFLALGAVSAAAALLALVGVPGAGGGATLEARLAEFGPMLAVQAVAGIGGALVLRGAEWGRWLVLGWMGYHVVLGFFHDLTELLVHGAMMALLTYVLYRPGANDYFRRQEVGVVATGG